MNSADSPLGLCTAQEAPIFFFFFFGKKDRRETAVFNLQKKVFASGLAGQWKLEAKNFVSAWVRFKALLDA